MKKATLFIAAFLMAGAMKAQDSVTLDIQLLPSKKYEQASVQNIQMDVEYGGGAQKMDMKISINGEINTKKETNGMIPVVMGTSMSMSMEMEGMPGNSNDVKMDMYGKVKKGEFVPVFDSIVAPDMPSQAKQLALEGVKDMLTKIDYPKKTLKIGETFVQDVPIDMPLGGGAVKMNDKITYTLKKVESKKAYFDVVHNISMDGSLADGLSMKGSGNGTGKMVYDIDTKYPVVNNGEMSMDLDMEQGGMPMKMKMVTKVSQTTQVSNTK